MNKKIVTGLVAFICLAFTLGVVGTSSAACYKGTEKECKAAIRSPKNACSDMEDAVEEMQAAMKDGDMPKAKEYAQEIMDEYDEYQAKAAKANSKIDKAEQTASDARAVQMAKRYRKRMVEYSANAQKAKMEAEKVLAP